jgi:hypothetical protein
MKLMQSDVDTICELLRRESRSLSDRSDTFEDEGRHASADAANARCLRLSSLADRLRDARHVDVVTARRPSVLSTALANPPSQGKEGR